MKKRIITSVVALCILLPVLIFADTPALPAGLALCALLAVYEMLHCLGLGRSLAIGIPFCLAAAAFPFLVRYLPRESGLVFPIVGSAAVLGVLYLFAVLIFTHGRYRLQDLGVCYMSLLYILTGFGGIIYIHDYEIGGQYLYLVVFLGAWVTDIFAYFCGLLLGRGGKHKLVPDVSPKKTVEGSIGGIVFCALAMLLFGVIVERIEPGIQANLWLFVPAGIVISVVAQLGDLSMSVIKRSYGIKDYGKIFPGHGGVLDRFDSVLAVSVVLLVFTSFFSFFEGMAL